MTNNNMIFVANWKMHGIFSDISKVKIVSKLLKNKKYKKLKVVYCPPFTLLKSFSDHYKNTKIKFKLDYDFNKEVEKLVLPALNLMIDFDIHMHLYLLTYLLILYLINPKNFYRYL